MKENNIGSARRAYAKRNNISFTQEDAARYFDVSIGTYRNWEQGRTEPSGAQISKMADLYGTTIDYLLGVTPIVTYAVVSYKDSNESTLVELYRNLTQEQQDAILALLRSM